MNTNTKKGGGVHWDHDPARTNEKQNKRKSLKNMQKRNLKICIIVILMTFPIFSDIYYIIRKISSV